MLIPSIDLRDGKAVQLRQGQDLVLTSDRDPVDLAREFNRYGEIAVIDLDAALGTGSNLELIRRICKVADARVGGGIRDVQRARELLRAGAQQIIIGTAADPDLLRKLPADRVIIAIDNRKGEVVDKGWTRNTGEDATSRAKRLEELCGGFLCTFVEREGGLGGLDHDQVRSLQQQIGRPLTVAGGVASTEEAVALIELGVDVQVGMSLYKGLLDPVEVVVRSTNFNKMPLIPTIAQDEAGQVLMLAYSSPESLRQALTGGKGVYYSRSRAEIWEKGLTSGSTQALLACRTDCDRDTLLFTVRQHGAACHTESYSCFGKQRFSMQKLYEILQERRATMPEGSYSAQLFKNRDMLYAKIAEEAQEVIEAREHGHVVWEIADVIFFLSALAVDEEISFSEVVAELAGRH